MRVFQQPIAKGSFREQYCRSRLVVRLLEARHVVSLCGKHDNSTEHAAANIKPHHRPRLLVLQQPQDLLQLHDVPPMALDEAVKLLSSRGYGPLQW